MDNFGVINDGMLADDERVVTHRYKVSYPGVVS